MTPGIQPPDGAATIQNRFMRTGSSAWALHVLSQDPNIEVERLTITPTVDRVAIHGTRVEILEVQAEAVGLPDPLKARHRFRRYLDLPSHTHLLTHPPRVRGRVS